MLSRHCGCCGPPAGVHYGHVCRARQPAKQHQMASEIAPTPGDDTDDAPSAADRRRLRRGHRATKWRGRSQLIRRIYKADLSWEGQTRPGNRPHHMSGGLYLLMLS